MDNTTVLAESIHEQLEQARKDACPTGFVWEDVVKFREYYRGYQRQTLNADQIRVLQGVVGNRFSHNVCKKVITEKANRLDIARFDVDDVGVRDFLFDLWVKNQLPDVFSEILTAALRDANAYVGLNWIPNDDPDDVYGGRVSVGLERAWDGNTGMFVVYGPDRRPVYAVKEWLVSDVRFRTLYYPDHIVRYMKVGEGWEGYNLPTDPQPAPFLGYVPWLKKDGSPIGIPVIHIPNGSDDDSNYGTSELDGGVLGFQDQINAIQHDITSLAMLNGSPRTWSKGFTLPKDPQTNEPKAPKTGPGAHWHDDEETAEWGILQAGDPKTLIDTLWVKVQAVCQMTDTPIHSITGQWPSGEALFRAEMPLVQAVEKLAKKVGPGMASVAHRATEIQNAFGRKTLDENKLITTIFFNVDKRDPLTRATYVEKVGPHVSRREKLRLLDYSPDRIEEILQEMDREAEEAVERQQQMFAAGAVTPFPARSDNPRQEQDNEDETEDDSE